ncbi:GYDIA family GHMP kinase [Flavobacterium sp.]|uniref:GYDIA family GHMP kinase n=1 Tax=Flavobacterium sp. TaxID=239 RepID=UPI0037BF8AE5
MKQTFYSNGKLLITGEYVVLDGAKALALPTKFGQNLVVESGTANEITWKSYDSDGSLWFEDTIPFENILFPKKYTGENAVLKTLLEILHEAYLLNPIFLEGNKGYAIKTQLSFPKKWGLGTSSTLINNIGQWLGINAFTLLNNSFGGSGYDIACAQNNSPIIYQLLNEAPLIHQVPYLPEFRNYLNFVYLNRKQSSKSAISNYINKQNDLSKTITIINKITETIVSTNDLKTFTYQIEKHESLLSEVLEMNTVKEAFFDDFKGVVKSLGAWGGDFVLTISKENPSGYFKEKGFDTVIRYDDMILK